jgi:gamma-glutamyl phosphate reductase
MLPRLKLAASLLILCAALSLSAQNRGQSDKREKTHNFTKDQIAIVEAKLNEHIGVAEAKRQTDLQRLQTDEERLKKIEDELEKLKAVGDPVKIAEMQAEVQKHTLYFQIVIGLVGLIATAAVGELARRLFTRGKATP